MGTEPAAVTTVTGLGQVLDGADGYVAVVIQMRTQHGVRGVVLTGRHS